MTPTTPDAPLAGAQQQHHQQQQDGAQPGLVPGPAGFQATPRLGLAAPAADSPHGAAAPAPHFSGANHPGLVLAPGSAPFLSLPPRGSAPANPSGPLGVLPLQGGGFQVLSFPGQPTFHLASAAAAGVGDGGPASLPSFLLAGQAQPQWTLPHPPEPASAGVLWGGSASQPASMVGIKRHHSTGNNSLQQAAPGGAAAGASVGSALALGGAAAGQPAAAPDGGAAPAGAVSSRYHGVTW